MLIHYRCHCWIHTYNHLLYVYLYAVIMCRSAQSWYQVSCEWTDSAGLKHRRPGAQDRSTHCLLLKVWSKSKSLIWHLQVYQWSTMCPSALTGIIATHSPEQECQPVIWTRLLLTLSFTEVFWVQALNVVWLLVFSVVSLSTTNIRVRTLLQSKLNSCCLPFTASISLNTWILYGTVHRKGNANRKLASSKWRNVSC